MRPGGDTVTLVRFMDGNCFCTVMEGASWHDENAITPEGRHVGTVRVRIPEEFIIELPRPGDWMVRGELREAEHLGEVTDHRCIRIRTVRDNRRGRLRHVSVWGT